MGFINAIINFFKMFSKKPLAAKAALPFEPKQRANPMGMRPEDLPPGGHYHSTEPTKLNAEYAYLWTVAKVERFEDQAIKAAKFIYENKDRYRAVAIKCKGSMPYWFVGVIHHMEASFDFRSALHNGDKIIGTGKKTTHVPAGKGPFATWEEGAIDALSRFMLFTEWSLPSCFRRLEQYNGFGYRGATGAKTTPQYASAYTFAGTQFFLKGKYVRDHQFDANKPDSRPGCMAILLKLIEIDPELAHLR